MNRKDYLIKYREEHREKHKKYMMEYNKKIKSNPELYKKKLDGNRSYSKNRKKVDPLFRLTYNMRRRISTYLTYSKMFKNDKTFNYIGCSITNLKQHLENQFQSGMNWNNYGDWHVDHIIPLKLAKTEEDLYKLCHYTNLQPLWAIDNFKKQGIYK